jgi:hypothetical protein
MLLRWVLGSIYGGVEFLVVHLGIWFKLHSLTTLRVIELFVNPHLTLLSISHFIQFDIKGVVNHWPPPKAQHKPGQILLKWDKGLKSRKPTPGIVSCTYSLRYSED